MTTASRLGLNINEAKEILDKLNNKLSNKIGNDARVAVVEAAGSAMTRCGQAVMRLMMGLPDSVPMGARRTAATFVGMHGVIGALSPMLTTLFTQDRMAKMIADVSEDGQTVRPQITAMTRDEILFGCLFVAFTEDRTDEGARLTFESAKANAASAGDGKAAGVGEAVAAFEKITGRKLPDVFLKGFI